MSKSKSLIKDSWMTVEVSKDGSFDRVLIVATKVILNPENTSYSSEKFYKLIDEVKSNLGNCERANIFNRDDM